MCEFDRTFGDDNIPALRNRCISEVTFLLFKTVRDSSEDLFPIPGGPKNGRIVFRDQERYELNFSG